MIAHPVCLSIGGVSVMCVASVEVFYKKYVKNRLLFMLDKELQRRASKKSKFE